MTEAQKETLRFYATNDYLLINGLLWGEDAAVIDEFIQIINTDGRGVMQEAIDQGFDVRWKCSKEDGEKLFKVFQKRFPVIDEGGVKEEILERARQDIENMRACLEPSEKDMVLYRKIGKRYAGGFVEGQALEYMGFSSCSLSVETAEKYINNPDTSFIFEIFVPAGTPVIRLDLMEDVRNEADEVIIAPMEFFVDRIDRENKRAHMTCKRPL